MHQNIFFLLTLFHLTVGKSTFLIHLIICNDIVSVSNCSRQNKGHHDAVKQTVRWKKIKNK